jgi:condensin complex subunit 2
LHLSAENTEAAAKPRREKKEAFKIDFFTPSEISIKEFAKQKFAPVTRGAGINLPGHGPTTTASKSSSKRGSKKGKEKDTEKRVEQVLPDDMHFSSRQLVTLYLKPKFSVCTISSSAVCSLRTLGPTAENAWPTITNREWGWGDR